MAITLTSEYRKHTVPLKTSKLQEMLRFAETFLTDERVQEALRQPRDLMDREFLNSPYPESIPDDFKRYHFLKDGQPRFLNHSYGHTIQLLQFLLRMTGKEIIRNPQGLPRFGDVLFDLSTLHEKFLFLQAGIASAQQPSLRSHFGACEGVHTNLQTQVEGECGGTYTVEWVQPTLQVTMNDGWGVRENVRTKLHRCCVALNVGVRRESGSAIPHSKRRRGYASDFSLPELVHRMTVRDNANVNEREHRCRTHIEGQGWTMLLVAIHARRQMEDVLGAHPQRQCMSMVMDASGAVAQQRKIVFDAAGTGPLQVGRMPLRGIGFDASQPLTIVNQMEPDDLQHWLLEKYGSRRNIDWLLRGILTKHDENAHEYWQAKKYAEEAGQHWKESGEKPGKGRWF